MITTKPPFDPPTAGSPALRSLPRAPYVIPPELRRLRAAWAWARRENDAAAQWAQRCGQVIESCPGPRTWVISATTNTGGGLCVTINSDDHLVILLVEDDPIRLAILLPPHLRLTSEAIA